MLFWLYNIVLLFGILIGFPLIIVILFITGKNKTATLAQRFGCSTTKANHESDNLNNCSSQTLWIHALSVGEVISSVPLVNALKNNCEQTNIVFSVSTETGFEIATKLFKPELKVIFFPYDLLFCVKLISSGINPDLVIIVETDIWPNFMFEMKKRGIPVILVNARLSSKSLYRYKCFIFLFKSVFSSFSMICAQSLNDAKNFHRLDIPLSKITVTGNMKFDQDEKLVINENSHILEKLNIKTDQTVMLAGSTHKGEESIILSAFVKIRKKFPDMVLVIVPRAPNRAGAVCSIVQSVGLSAVLLNKLNTKNNNMRYNVIVIGILGILKQLYSIADIAIVGGSLLNIRGIGGHNPLEPAAFAKPIIYGKNMKNFSHISHLLLEAEAAIQVSNATSLYNAVIMLLEDKEKAIKMGQKAKNVLYANSGAVKTTLDVIQKTLS